MDPLTSALQSLRPRGAALHPARLSAPWGFITPGGHVSYHVVLEGRCRIDVAGEDPVSIGPGDVAVLPHGHVAAFSDPPSTPTPSLAALHEGATYGPDGAVHAGGGGTATVLVTGKVDLDAHEGHPLFEALPAVLVVPARGGDAAPWLRATLELLACEATAGQPGSGLVLGQLSGVVFVQAVRAWLAREPGRGASWAHALADPRVGRSLAAVHADPAAPWTVASLAREAGMGRSAFSERFARLVGEPPLGYVTRWRMVEAARWLREDPAASLAVVAEGVGYASEAAFGRQFTRVVGRPPGAYRRGQRG